MISFILLKNQTYIIMQMTILFLTVTLTFLKPRMSSHPKVNMSLSGLVQTRIQANPGKFQAIVLGKRGHSDCESFTIHDILLNVKIQSSS